MQLSTQTGLHVSVHSAVAVALHHWIPEGVHSFGEMTVAEGDLVPDPKWLCYEIVAEVELNL